MNWKEIITRRNTSSNLIAYFILYNKGLLATGYYTKHAHKLYDTFSVLFYWCVKTRLNDRDERIHIRWIIIIPITMIGSEEKPTRDCYCVMFVLLVRVILMLLVLPLLPIFYGGRCGRSIYLFYRNKHSWMKILAFLLSSKDTYRVQRFGCR